MPKRVPIHERVIAPGRPRMNRYVRSAQLDQDTWKMADELMDDHDISFSRLVRTMIRKVAADHRRKKREQETQDAEEE